MRTAISLIALAALLALPLAPTASPVAAKNRSRTITRTFSNTAKIDLPATNVYVNPALLYPSPIAVSGRKGTIRDVNLRLNDFTHNGPNDVLVLLTGPRGQTAIVMAVAGGSAQVSNVSLKLDDEATASMGDDVMVQSGAYRPTNSVNSSIEFPAPAPTVTSANAALSVFDGTDPNGTWHLFVLDQSPASAGAFAGGWELEITTKVKAKKKR